MPKRILITGSSGYLGRLLTRALEAHPLVERIAGVDIAAPPAAGPKFVHYQADIRDEFLLRSILEEEAIDTVFHLAFVTGEPRDEVRAREINVSGTLTVLDAANKSSAARRLIVAGSTWAYGARRGNPDRIKEDQPLRASTLRSGVHERVMEEEIGKSMPQVRRSLGVAILRLCAIARGSRRAEGPLAALLGGSRVYSVLFRRGALQFVSESDLLNVLVKAMEAADLSGAFNVAPDDCATLEELCRALGKPRLALPYPALWLWLFLARRLWPKSGLTERAVSYLAYPVVASNDKIKRALGVTFEKESLAAYLEAQAGADGAGESADLTAGARTLA